MRYCVRNPRLRFCGREEFTELVRGMFLAVVVASPYAVLADHKTVTAGGTEIAESGRGARAQNRGAIFRTFSC